MIGESSQLVLVETVLIAGSIRIGSALAGPDISYPTVMGVPASSMRTWSGPLSELGPACFFQQLDPTLGAWPGGLIPDSIGSTRGTKLLRQWQDDE